MGLTALKLGTFLLAASEPSKIPFYIAGGLLAGWAVLVSFLGLSRADFPGTPGRARAVMAISAVLVLGATSMAVATSARKKHDRAASATPETSSSKAPGSSSAAGTLTLTADPSGQLRFDRTSLSARPGSVKIDFVNRSPTAHNVTVEGGGRTVGSTPTITGSTAALTVELKPGTYTYYCSVPGHRQAGMQGTLTVQ